MRQRVEGGAGGQRGEDLSARHSARRHRLKDSTKPFCCGLPSAMCCAPITLLVLDNA